MKFKGLYGLMCLISLLCACGGGSGSNGIGAPPPPTATSTTVTVKFSGATPTAAATQVGDQTFVGATPASQITFALPPGVNYYAVAFVCPPVPGTSYAATEFVAEASVTDTISPTLSCSPLSQQPTGTATGTISSFAVDSLGVSYTLSVVGADGSGGGIDAPSGSFSVTMPVGLNDIAVVLIQSTPQNDLTTVAGIKIVRSQTVPGVVGGSGITLTSADDVPAFESVTGTDMPSGFDAQPASVFYTTSNGTTFYLDTNAVGGATTAEYAVVPAASSEPGDFYTYDQVFYNSTSNQSTGVYTTTTDGGGAATFASPPAWSYAGPTPVARPTFTYSYSGFPGLLPTEYSATLQWSPTSTTLSEISVIATANFMSGADTITIPDLSSIAGFPALPASGTAMTWIADIFGGTVDPIAHSALPVFYSPAPFSPPTSANSSGMFVENSGSYTQP